MLGQFQPSAHSALTSQRAGKRLTTRHLPPHLSENGLGVGDTGAAGNFRRRERVCYGHHSAASQHNPQVNDHRICRHGHVNRHSIACRHRPGRMRRQKPRGVVKTRLVNSVLPHLADSHKANGQQPDAALPGCRPRAHRASATWALLPLSWRMVMLCSSAGAASSAHTMAGGSGSRPAGRRKESNRLVRCHI